MIFDASSVVVAMGCHIDVCLGRGTHLLLVILLLLLLLLLLLQTLSGSCILLSSGELCVQANLLLL